MKLRFVTWLSVVALLLTTATQALAQTPPQQYHIPAPTIVDVVERTSPHHQKPVITGVTFNNTLVDIYIDDVFYGKATVINDSSGVASFAYEPFLPLADGPHTIKAVARSLDQTVRSAESERVTIIINQPPSAPTLLDATTDEHGVTIVNGLIANDLTVEIYVEGKKHVSFVPPTSQSGITSFWYKPHLPAGEYTVSARAVTASGNTSEFVERRVLFGKEMPSQTEEQVPDSHEPDEQQPENQELPEDTEVMQDATEGSEVVFEDEQDVPVITTPEDLESLLENNDPVVVDETDDEATVVTVEDEEQGSIVVTQADDQEELALNDVESDMIITDTESATTSDDEEDEIIFGEGDKSINEGAMEEQVNELDEEVQDRNRTAGFVILLLIAIALAIWYVKEKRQAERERMGGDAVDQDDDNLLN